MLLRTPRRVRERHRLESLAMRVRAERALVIAKVLTDVEWTSERRAVLRAAAVLCGDDKLEPVICGEYCKP